MACAIRFGAVVALAAVVACAGGCATSYRQHVPDFRTAGRDNGPVTGVDRALEGLQTALDNFENDVENGM